MGCRSSRKMSTASGGGNRLKFEKSPYLLQHANNPVDWYPWGTEAFEKAKKENKVIFLSVGYSTCHWCHVMERESFENAEIGKLMSDNFVNIKVDREERPDVDKMYMSVVQAISGSGGWPMSVFLTPDLKPITGGTYFPPTDHFGRPGFPSILKLVANQWRDKREGVLEQSSRIFEAIKSFNQSDSSHALPNATSVLKKCYQLLKDSFEDVQGGFSRAPKFPQPVNIDFLLRYYKLNRSSDEGKKALSMVEHTLKCMQKGGIHDHIAQGFHRYSTDAKWHVPHFEKMLYDQAQLTVAYAEAYMITRDPLYRDTVQDIITYVQRDLGSPSGGFYSAEDADSLPTQGDKDKKEGAFCVWTKEEVERLLVEKIDGTEVKLSELFSTFYNVKQSGNVDPRSDPHGELKMQNVLFCDSSKEAIGKRMNLSEDKVGENLEKARQILFDARLKRPKPHLDDKMITAWNGLMLSGLAAASNALQCAEYVKRAELLVKFIKDSLSREGGKKLLRSCYTDEHRNVTQIDEPICGFADDYAFLIQGLIDLYEVNFDDSLLEWATYLQKSMDEQFWDSDDGGYFLSRENDPSILMRMKEDQDGAEPSANSVAALNLARLGAILDDDALKKRAVDVLKAFTSRIDKIPLILPKMLVAYMYSTKPVVNIVLCGDPKSKEMTELMSCVQSQFIPLKSVVLLSDQKGNFLRSRNEFYKQFEVSGIAQAFVCKDKTCSLPVQTKEQLMKLIEQ